MALGPGYMFINAVDGTDLLVHSFVWGFWQKRNGHFGKFRKSIVSSCQLHPPADVADGLNLTDGGPQAMQTEGLPEVEAQWVAEEARDTARNVVNALCRHRFGDKVCVDEVDACWEAPVLPLCADLVAEAEGGQTVRAEQNGSGASGTAEHQEQGTERDGGPGDSPAGEASSMAIPNLQTTESGADPDACSRLPFLFTFFLQNPPENIRVDADSLICEVDQVRILLSLPEAADWFQTCDLPWFLMDFTMKTNAPGLVLACAGRHWTCRFEAAHGLLMQKDVAMAESAGMELTDGIFDCACYAAAKATVSEQGMLPSRLRLAALGLGVYCDLGTILLRLAIDWDETVFEQYIRANLLHVEGNVIRAFWQTGFGAAWVARAGGSHAAFAFASDPVCHVLDEPWRGAKTTWATRSVEQDGDDSEVELEQRSKRLSLDDMLKHFRKHAAGGTFLASVTSRVLSDGRQALLLYVLPTYRLELGTHRREDIAAALKLGLTTTVQQVHGACADPETGHYDFVRHMFLRRTYSTVYVRQVWLRMWKLVHAWMPAMLVLMPGSPIK
ncbi:Psmd10, partial [Symbiodinium sp. KB8]